MVVVWLLLSSEGWGRWSTLSSIWDKLSSLEFRISHIHREGNSVADALANLVNATRTFEASSAHSVASSYGSTWSAIFQGATNEIESMLES